MLFVFLRFVNYVCEGMSPRERDAEFNKAHEPLRWVVEDTEVLREKSKNAAEEGLDDGAAWLTTEAGTVREKETAARLVIVFRFFDTFTSTVSHSFVLTTPQVTRKLAERESSTQQRSVQIRAKQCFSLTCTCNVENKSAECSTEPCVCSSVSILRLG